MADEEGFLSRWSRLKRQTVAAPAVTPGAVPTPAPVELPALDSLGFDSDFTEFLRAEIDEKLKQAALRKLFHSPRFNQIDGLDVYIDDYNSFEPISEAMLRELNHAQDLLCRKDEQTGLGEPDRQVAADQAPAAIPATESSGSAGDDEEPEQAQV